MWICILAGSTLGGLLPEAWGASAFGLSAIVGGLVGAIGGVWIGARINGSL